MHFVSLTTLLILSLFGPAYAHPIPETSNYTNATFAANARWAAGVEQTDPGYFTRNAQSQAPAAMWIGCADSRVPESVITASMPGEIFVQRNVANQVILSDSNTLAAVSYAIAHLNVTDIIVAGHTNCGGIAAALAAVHAHTSMADPKQAPSSALNKWLQPLVRLVTMMPTASADDIMAANIRTGIEHLAESEPVLSAWKAGKPLTLHGWVYDLETGRLRDLGISRAV